MYEAISVEQILNHRKERKIFFDECAAVSLGDIEKRLRIFLLRHRQMSRRLLQKPPPYDLPWQFTLAAPVVSILKLFTLFDFCEIPIVVLRRRRGTCGTHKHVYCHRSKVDGFYLYINKPSTIPSELTVIAETTKFSSATRLGRDHKFIYRANYPELRNLLDKLSVGCRGGIGIYVYGCRA